MNKQEYIGKLRKLITTPYKKGGTDFDYGHDYGVQRAIHFAEDLNDGEIKHINSSPSHYQGTTQPIDLINAQNLNFNLGNVVKYVCRAGKKQGESNLKDLEKAKDYINYEINRLNTKENNHE